MAYRVILSHLRYDFISILSCNRQGEALDYSRWLAMGMLTAFAVAVGACAPAPASGRRVVPSYDDFTGRLVQLSADQNGDGRLDQRTYLDGNRPLRGEADTNGDGRVDRWEYFDRQAALVSIGTSSLEDGVEDTWTEPTPSATGEMHVARSRRRDRQRDRHEYFRGTALVRVEEDTNADGRIDRWDRYEGTVLREAAFDTTFTGRPADRRVLYDDKGRFLSVDADPDGDGRFVRVQSEAGQPARNPGAFE